MTIKNITVLGAGRMGTGIAISASQAGVDAVLFDMDAGALDKAVRYIESYIKKNDISANEIIPQNNLENAVLNADIVIEAVYEQENIKKELFKKIEPITGDKTIIATNTSSIPVTRLASALVRPERFIGIHFMNPVPKMPLVEIIRANQTSDETYRTAIDFCGQLGKNTVTSADRPGFIINRILMPLINEAAFALMEGVAAPEDIDKAMTLGLNHPMGPLTLADFIGLDICLNIMETLFNETKDPKFRPCFLIKNKVDAGELGKKTGKGFFKWP